MDVTRQMQIQVSESDQAPGLYTLTTSGLKSAQRPELQIVRVPKDVVRDAGVVLNMLADYSANRRPVSAGERVALGLGRAHLVVQLVPADGTDVDGGASPSEATVSGEPLGTLRIVSPEPDADLDAPPREAIATVIFTRATQASEAGNPEAAVSELERSLRFFPGDAARARPSPFREVIFNLENQLSWHELSQLVGGEASDRCFDEALRRSPDLVAVQLGLQSTKALAHIAEGDLEGAAARIVEVHLGSAYVVENMGPVAMLATPLWTCGVDGQVERRLALLPPRFAELYFSGPARAALEDGRAANLAVKALRWSASHPAALALQTRATREAWFDGGAPASQVELGWETCFGPLSLLLAHVARGFAAGCNEDMVKALLGLPAPEGSLVAGAQRLEAQQSREDGWKAEALANAQN